MASLQVPFTYNLINKINAFKYGELRGLCGVIHIRCRHIYTYNIHTYKTSNYLPHPNAFSNNILTFNLCFYMLPFTHEISTHVKESTSREPDSKIVWRMRLIVTKFCGACIQLVLMLGATRLNPSAQPLPLALPMILLNNC